jgi:hypothetical protein
VLGALYPLATCFVILGTANHYVLDAIAGVVTLCLAVGLQRLLSGRRTFARPLSDSDALESERELINV